MTALPPRQPNKCARCGNDWYDTHTCPALGSQTAVPMPKITRGWPSINPVFGPRQWPHTSFGKLRSLTGDHPRCCAKCVADHTDDYQSTVDPRPIYWVDLCPGYGDTPCRVEEVHDENGVPTGHLLCVTHGEAVGRVERAEMNGAQMDVDNAVPLSTSERMSRQMTVLRVANGLMAEHDGWQRLSMLDIANAAVDVLIDDATLMPSERWDEECHRCEQRIGDHLVDGRCPTGGIKEP